MIEPRGQIGAQIGAMKDDTVVFRRGADGHTDLASGVQANPHAGDWCLQGVLARFWKGRNMVHSRCLALIAAGMNRPAAPNLSAYPGDWRFNHCFRVLRYNILNSRN